MSGKYQMTLTEEQIMLIANCVEDCHRFACGETELWNTIASMNGHGELRAKMKELHDFAVPELSANQYYDWAGSGCKNKIQKKFIAMTYAIYREIIHNVVNAGVYKSHTLTCKEGGTPPRIDEVNEKNKKHIIKIIDFEKYGDFNSWVKYRADEKVLTFMGKFEQDENGMYLHTHIFDDGTEITFNF